MSLLIYFFVVVINRCVFLFLIDVLEKGKNLVMEISNLNVNVIDVSGNVYDSVVIEGGFR